MSNVSGSYYQCNGHQYTRKSSKLVTAGGRKRRLHRACCWLLLLGGAILIAQGGYMQAKAHFAQFLIQQAWLKTLQDRQPHKPWSWADTHPVAKMDFLEGNMSDVALEHQPVNGDSLYVLAGASGRNLAFGPAQMLSSANINTRGNTVIAGHRDTHFSRLEAIKLGQLIRLQNAAGKTLVYKVTKAEVVHESDMSVTEDSGESVLTLVTCYPFGAQFAGGEQRFVVQATPIN